MDACPSLRSSHTRPGCSTPETAHGAFLDDGALIRDAGKLAGIPGVLVHGRSDLGGPVITPWELAQAWPRAELIVIGDSGHTGSAAMQEALDSAGERLFAAITGR